MNNAIIRTALLSIVEKGEIGRIEDANVRVRLTDKGLIKTEKVKVGADRGRATHMSVVTEAGFAWLENEAAQIAAEFEKLKSDNDRLANVLNARAEAMAVAAALEAEKNKPVLEVAAKAKAAPKKAEAKPEMSLSQIRSALKKAAANGNISTREKESIAKAIGLKTTLAVEIENRVN